MRPDLQMILFQGINLARIARRRQEDSVLQKDRIPTIAKLSDMLQIFIFLF